MTLFRRAGVRLQLIVDENTTEKEIKEFTIERLNSEIILTDPKAIIYDFNNHPPNLKAIKQAIQNFREWYGKTNKEFVIPYGRAEVWTYMLQYLPEHLRKVPILMPFKVDSRVIYQIMYEGRFYRVIEI